MMTDIPEGHVQVDPADLQDPRMNFFTFTTQEELDSFCSQFDEQDSLPCNMDCQKIGKLKLKEAILSSDGDDVTVESPAEMSEDFHANVRILHEDHLDHFDDHPNKVPFPNYPKHLYA